MSFRESHKAIFGHVGLHVSGSKFEWMGSGCFSCWSTRARTWISPLSICRLSPLWDSCESTVLACGITLSSSSLEPLCCSPTLGFCCRFIPPDTVSSLHKYLRCGLNLFEFAFLFVCLFVCFILHCFLHSNYPYLIMTGLTYTRYMQFYICSHIQGKINWPNHNQYTYFCQYLTNATY